MKPASADLMWPGLSWMVLYSPIRELELDGVSMAFMGKQIRKFRDFVRAHEAQRGRVVFAGSPA